MHGIYQCGDIFRVNSGMNTVAQIKYMSGADNTGHVFNLGHGIHPGIDPENVAALVDIVHTYRDE